jgi:polyphosphate kinase
VEQVNRADVGSDRDAGADAPIGRAGPSSAAPQSVPRAVVPRAVPDDADDTHPHLYFNRELSWLDFNWRVLYQALDARVPLLERVRFLTIAQSNLDEFVRKRVGGLRRQQVAGVVQLSQDGRTPGEQLALIHDALLVMKSAMTRAWESELRPLLEREADVHVVSYDEIGPDEAAALHAHFRSSVYPILTPLAVDPGHPFPFISNQSLSLAIVLRHPERGTEHFARLKIPTARTRWVTLEPGRRYLAVEQLILRHIDELFRGMTVESAHLFRLTRNADMQRDDEEAEDLLQMISEELRERRFAPVVRLEVEPEMPVHVRELLCRELEIDLLEIHEVHGMIDLSGLATFADLDLPELRYEPWDPVTPPRMRHIGQDEEAPDTFAVLRAGDVLVHHPYDSFNFSVQRFIEEAADDPQVLAIKQTLYRTSDDSRVVQALARAAERGKQVAVLVEVTARFDEENNIEWAQLLEKSGAHVTYGVVGLKTHSKVTLVVREETEGIRAYCHVGTGNYHARTARLYSDIGLLTCAPDVGWDIVHLFHYLTGFAPEQEYQRLLVAPRDLRAALLRLVEREIAHQRDHGDGRIILKMNALDDAVMIRALYRASRAGVRVDLIVRGHTRLRPGLAGHSENIRLISIIGRFLEHDRIFCFHNHGEPDVFIGSADWRRRNLDGRVEAVVRIDDPAHSRQLHDTLLLALADNCQAWELDGHGTYTLRTPAPGEAECCYHREMMHRALARARG